MLPPCSYYSTGGVTTNAKYPYLAEDACGEEASPSAARRATTQPCLQPLARRCLPAPLPASSLQKKMHSVLAERQASPVGHQGHQRSSLRHVSSSLDFNLQVTVL